MRNVYRDSILILIVYRFRHLLVYIVLIGAYKRLTIDLSWHHVLVMLIGINWIDDCLRRRLEGSCLSLIVIDRIRMSHR